MTSVFFVTVRICSNQFKCSYVKKQKASCQLFAPFLKSASNFEHFEKKMTLTAFVFAKLQTGENLVKPMCEKHHFRTPFNSRHAKGSQTFVKSG